MKVERKGRRAGGMPRRLGNGRVGFLHANKDGSPVLIGESSWRTISGVYVNIFGGYWLVVWRG